MTDPKHVPQIVKVQRPLIIAPSRRHPGNPDEPWLIYAKRRKWTRAQSVPEEVKKAVGTDAKGYFEAVMGDNDLWIIGKKVGEQSW